MKKRIFIIIATLTTMLAVPFTACVEEPEDFKFPTDKYFHDIPEISVTEDYVIGAMYHELTEGYWYETISDGGNTIILYHSPQEYTGHPLLGDTTKVVQNGGYYINKDYTSGGEPWGTRGTAGVVLRKQLDYAKLAGIDFFLINWNGHGTDTLLFNFKNTWVEGDPKVALVFDCGHLYKVTDDSLHTSVRPNYVNRVFLRQLDSIKVFFNEPYYYKIDGTTPLFGFDNYLRTPSVANTVAELREHVGNVFLISPTVTRENGYTSPEYFVNIKNKVAFGNSTKDIYIFRENGEKNGQVQIPFEAIYQPAMLTDNYSRYGYDNWQKNYFSIIDDNYSYWKQKMEGDYGKEFIPSVMPAFDNSKNDSTSNILRLPGTQTRLLQRETDGALYKTYANVGKKNAGKHRIIFINSWNNFKQGSSLEPTTEYRKNYLTFTKKYFKKN